MNYSLLSSLTEIIVIIGIIGTIICLFSMLLIKKDNDNKELGEKNIEREKVIKGIFKVTIMLLVLSIVGAVLSLNSSADSTESSNEYIDTVKTKIQNYNISSSNDSSSPQNITSDNINTNSN